MRMKPNRKGTRQSVRLFCTAHPVRSVLFVVFVHGEHNFAPSADFFQLASGFHAVLKRPRRTACDLCNQHVRTHISAQLGRFCGSSLSKTSKSESKFRNAAAIASVNNAFCISTTIRRMARLRFSFDFRPSFVLASDNVFAAVRRILPAVRLSPAANPLRGLV